MDHPVRVGASAGPKPRATIAAKARRARVERTHQHGSGPDAALIPPARKARYSTSAPVPEPHGRSPRPSRIGDGATSRRRLECVAFAANLLKLENARQQLDWTIL